MTSVCNRAAAVVHRAIEPLVLYDMLFKVFGLLVMTPLTALALERMIATSGSLAIADGADYAEIELDETADGTLVLLHVTDLMRVAGVNTKIWEAEYSRIKDLVAGSWFSPESAGEPSDGELLPLALSARLRE